MPHGWGITRTYVHLHLPTDEVHVPEGCTCTSMGPHNIHPSLMSQMFQKEITP